MTGFRYTDYRLSFLSSLAYLLLLDIGLYTGNVGIQDVWCIRLLSLIPVWGLYASSPWMGLPRPLSAVLAAHFICCSCCIHEASTESP